MLKVFALLIAFQAKHFLADYPLQKGYMLGKFKEKNWALPLAVHCGVHAAFTFAIVLACVWNIAGPWSLFAPFLLAGFDFTVHFIMDRIKASPYLLGRFKALGPSQYLYCVENPNPFTKLQLRGNTFFWWSLGLDQTVHHLTHYVIIYLLCV